MLVQTKQRTAGAVPVAPQGAVTAASHQRTPAVAAAQPRSLAGTVPAVHCRGAAGSPRRKTGASRTTTRRRHGAGGCRGAGGGKSC
eukprot:4831673-Amphidinium_carterae.1